MTLVPFAQRNREIVGNEGLFGNIAVLERLEDFRKRIIRAFLAVAGGVMVGFALIDRIAAFILAPTRRALPPGTTLIYTQPGEAFGLYIQIALIAGIVFAMPFIMFQLWRLIAPLVPPSARWFALPFVGFTTLGFVAGAAFTRYIAFPYLMAFAASFNTPNLMFMPRLEPVFDMYMKMVLGMAVVFQMPTVVFFLAKLGMVSAGFLSRSFRYAVLLIFVAAAVITPTSDMVTQAIFAAPMLALYLLSVAIAWMFGRVKPIETDRDE